MFFIPRLPIYFQFYFENLENAGFLPDLQLIAYFRSQGRQNESWKNHRRRPIEVKSWRSEEKISKR